SIVVSLLRFRVVSFFLLSRPRWSLRFPYTTLFRSPVRGFDPAPSSTLATACRQAWLPSTAPAGRPAAGPRAMRPGPMRPCARPRQRTLGAVLPPVIFFVDGMGYGVTRDLLQ